MTEREDSSRFRQPDRFTALAGLIFAVALVAAAVVLAIWSGWEQGAILGFLTAVAALGVPMLATLRATHAQNEKIAKIDEQTNGTLDRRIVAGAQRAAEEALIRYLTGQLPTPPPEPPPAPPKRGRR